MLSRIIDGVLGGYASGDSRIEAEIRGDRLMFPELAASTVALIVNEAGDQQHEVRVSWPGSRED